MHGAGEAGQDKPMWRVPTKQEDPGLKRVNDPSPFVKHLGDTKRSTPLEIFKYVQDQIKSNSSGARGMENDIKNVQQGYNEKVQQSVGAKLLRYIPGTKVWRTYHAYAKAVKLADKALKEQQPAQQASSGGEGAPSLKERAKRTSTTGTLHERGENLEELTKKTGEMKDAANEFAKLTQQLKEHEDAKAAARAAMSHGQRFMADVKAFVFGTD